MTTTRDSVPDIDWLRLRVTQYVDDFVLRFALHHAVSDLRHIKCSNIPGGKVVDSILVLLKLAVDTSAKEPDPDPRWVVVCAYLWTLWQRCLMLELRLHMELQLRGYDYQSNSSLYRKGTELIPEIHELLDRQHLQHLHRTPYLCGWSLQSLRNERASVTMDFRRFHDLYHAQFGERLPICNLGPTQCDGRSSHDCKRFMNTEIRDQSMHNVKCQGSCRRIFWSSDSFRGITGARAVDISSTDGETLRYCKVTENTLTISHVWSHGQGGRPDRLGPEGTGFNRCLHRRYADLAASLDCKSYWMDTPCIPSEKDLRWECISQITSVFATSVKTLICDRDVMTIDISGQTIDAYESVLATLLVCGWSVRAWTLLEAMRGRFGLYVLCLHNMVVSLEKLLKSVHAEGRIDLVTLFLSRDYLFPPVTISEDPYFLGEYFVSELDLELENGFLSIGEAATLLSHRHATRDGDDLLIWSLLIGDVEDRSPVEMWKRQIGKEIKTGSLISSAQRVQGHPGLSWAPYLPNVLQHNRDLDKVSKVYPAYDGSETCKGFFTKEGLRVRWVVHRIPDLEILESPSEPSNLCAEIADQYLRGFKGGAMLQALPCQGPRSMGSRYRGVLGYVMVICGSHDGAAWEWRGIYEWNALITLPPSTMQEMLII